jgi:hypothetical protein
MYPSKNTAATPNLSFGGIDLEQNVQLDGEYGINIRINLKARNPDQTEHQLIAYFYSGDGKPLLDRNGRYTTREGIVAAQKPVSINGSTTTGSDTLFIPFKELELSCGVSEIKVLVAIFREGKKIAESGYSSFTYAQPCQEK